MKSIIFEICRWAAAAAAIVFLISLGTPPADSHADPRKVMEAACGSAEMTNMQQAPNQVIKRIYGINPSDYEYCVLYYPLTNMDVDELLIARYSDAEQESALCAAAGNRLDSQKQVFESYGVGQTELLTNHSVIDSCGGFFLFAVNTRSDDIHEAFIKALEEE